MSFAHRDFTPQRRLTTAESAILAREVLDRARQALRDRPVAIQPAPVANPGIVHRGAMPRSALRRVTSAVTGRVRGIVRSGLGTIGSGQGGELVVIVLCLMVSVIGATVHPHL
ncbi:hypothetical protein [Novosphingobium sp.]|uniref:hypothetical protein n=1 Tax=Novosphingobium sp. TaxID=1874826 RepID=UPI00333EBBCC